MAYNVSNNYRNIIYNGETKYNCRLYINDILVPATQIKNIVISSPIIDSTNETFYIGTFISQQITVTFKNLDGLDIKSGNNVYLEIGLYVNNAYEYVPIGYYLIDDLDEDYQTTCEITCLDYAIKFKPNIDYSPCFVDGSATLEQILIYICNYFNVTLGTYPTLNKDITTSQYDSTESGKTYISYIAEMMGGNAKIGRDGKLYIIPFKRNYDVEIDALKSISWSLGEKYEISGVSYCDAIRNYAYGNDDYNRLYIRQDNIFVSDTTQIENIYYNIRDIILYSVSNQNIGDISLDCWDIINFSVGDKNYLALNDNTLTYEISMRTDISPKIPTSNQESTTNVIGGSDNNTRLKIVKTNIDKINNEISLLSERIVQLSATNKGNGYVNFTNCNYGGLYTLSIKGQVNLFYPSSKQNGSLTTKSGIYKSGLIKSSTYQPYIENTYPSSTLFSSTSDITIKQNNSNDIVYTLPISHLNEYNGVYDEFIYQNGDCSIIRRIGIDPVGNKYILKNSITESLGKMQIVIPEGDSQLIFKSFPNTIIEVVYLTKNDYTNVFATQIQLSSELTIRDTEIDAKVTQGETISDINQTATQVKIKANKIALEGAITNNNGFSIDTSGNMTCNGATANNLNINGGNIELSDTGEGSDPIIEIYDATQVVNGIKNKTTQLASTGLNIIDKENNISTSYTYGGFAANDSYGAFGIDASGISFSRQYYEGGNIFRNMINSSEFLYSKDYGNYSSYMKFDNSTTNDYFEIDITGTRELLVNYLGVTCISLTQTSKEEMKKNFEKLQNALDIIKDIDIYKYNMKTQNDGDKKHIGFVIGDKFKYSKEITSQNNDGVDLYSMVSVCMKAIQEQQEQINSLKEEISILKDKIKE